MIALYENKNKFVVEYLTVFKEERKLKRLYENSSGQFWNYSACESTEFNIETLHNQACTQDFFQGGGKILRETRNIFFNPASRLLPPLALKLFLFYNKSITCPLYIL